MMQGSLAERLRVLRARQGLSLTEASKRAGITRDTLSDLERAKRHAYMPTLAKIAEGYGVPVEDLLEEPVPLDEASETGRSPGAPSEELTAQEWARRQNARLHGMTAEEWDDYLRTHDTVEELGETWKELSDESGMLHAALKAHKWQRPQDRGRRQTLSRGLRDLRMRRFADLYASAKPLHARDLVDEIFEAMREEANG